MQSWLKVHRNFSSFQEHKYVELDIVSPRTWMMMAGRRGTLRGTKRLGNWRTEHWPWEFSWIFTAVSLQRCHTLTLQDTKLGMWCGRSSFQWAETVHMETVRPLWCWWMDEKCFQTASHLQWVQRKELKSQLRLSQKIRVQPCHPWMNRGRGFVCTREIRIVCTRETGFVCTRDPRIMFMDSALYLLSSFAKYINDELTNWQTNFKWPTN